MFSFAHMFFDMHDMLQVQILLWICSCCCWYGEK